MRRYARHDGCLMEFLRRELDDPGAEPCGRCMWCVLEPLLVDPSPELSAAAREHLRGFDSVRATAEAVALGPGRVRGCRRDGSPEDERPEVGRALSVVGTAAGDGSWRPDAARTSASPTSW